MEVPSPIIEYDPSAEVLYFDGKPFVEITARAIPNIMPKKFYAAFDGTLYNSVTHKFSTGYVNQRGYVAVELTTSKGKRLHTSQHNIIEKVFDWFPGCENMEVNHINGIRNDNRRENLELVTHKENMEHAYRTGLNKNYGENHKDHSITEAQVRALCEYMTNGEDHSKETYAQIGNKFGITEIVVTNILTGRSWWRVSQEYGINKNYMKRNSRFTDEEVEHMCEIFVRMKGSDFDSIVNQVVLEMSYDYDLNLRHKIHRIYYKDKSYFTRITDKYDYL